MFGMEPTPPRSGSVRRPPGARPVARARETSPIRYLDEQEQLSRADARLDQRLESRHTVQLRQYGRDAEEGGARAARDAAEAAATVESLRKYFYQCKQQEAKARQESEYTAGGDVALMANFSQYDEALHRAAVLLGMDLA